MMSSCPAGGGFGISRPVAAVAAARSVG